MFLRPCLLAALGLAAVAPAASAAGYVPGEVVVRYAPAGGTTARAATESGPRLKVVRVRDTSVARAVQRLRRHRGVLSATLNYVAHASFVPDDPGNAGVPGGWQSLQWNFAGPFGVNAPAAWDNLARVGRPGGSRVLVAVLDTGVAYSDRGRFKRSPDLRGDRFARGRDFVDGDRYPNDLNGHGTHVASTIAESIDNGVGVTGLAYGARLMPVRVLDRYGAGDSVTISRGIRFAANHGVKIINLSFEFLPSVTAGEIPDIIDALRFARRKGVLVVGASGNTSARAVAYPARASDVLSVGATTEHGCLADYSNNGAGLDLVAPGGGPDAALAGDPNCRPDDVPGRNVFQLTFAVDRRVRTFGLPDTYKGTSMAAPHVAATAALVIASGVLGPSPSPAALEARLKSTARDLGVPGPDSRYGAGLVDAAAATAPPAL